MRLVLTNRYNDRGVRIDTELVQQAITCDLLLSDAMTTKAYELTGLENPNSVSQLKTWLDERGISMDTLGKKNVTEMIGELDKNGVDAEAMDMLKLRLQMAKSSVKKYQAAERCVCPDGRARGLFQFYGASRTGRYSGRNIQLQNLPQNHISTLDEARTLVKMGCFDMVESIYDRMEQDNERLADHQRSVLCNIREEVDALDTLLHDTRLNRARMQGAVRIIQQMINRELQTRCPCHKDTGV